MGIGKKRPSFPAPPETAVPSLFRIPNLQSRIPASAMSEHIVKSFDDELSQLNAAIARMGELTQSQFATTMNALRTRDVEDAAMVIRDDIDVDALERDIESRATSAK